VWRVLFDDECWAWFQTLEEGLQDEINALIARLEEDGPRVGRPYVDTLKGSSIPNLKELRVQYRGRPWRVLFAFDPERAAILLVGGCKAGDKRWYKTRVRIAEERFRRHLGQ